MVTKVASTPLSEASKRSVADIIRLYKELPLSRRQFINGYIIGQHYALFGEKGKEAKK